MKGVILRRKRSNSLPIVELFKRGEKEGVTRGKGGGESFQEKQDGGEVPMRKEEGGWDDIVKEIKVRF